MAQTTSKQTMVYFSFILYTHYSSSLSSAHLILHIGQSSPEAIYHSCLCGREGRDTPKRDTYHFLSHFIGQCTSHSHHDTKREGKENYPILGKELGYFVGNVSIAVNPLGPHTLSAVIYLVFKTESVWTCLLVGKILTLVV